MTAQAANTTDAKTNGKALREGLYTDQMDEEKYHKEQIQDRRAKGGCLRNTIQKGLIRLLEWAVPATD